MKYAPLLGVVALLAFTLTPAAAQPTQDDFWILLGDTCNDFVQGGGSGYGDDGDPITPPPWFYYPPDPQGWDWWNQWFDNEEFKPYPWHKVIHLELTIMPLCPNPELGIVYNWATPQWQEDYGDLNRPPLPEDPDLNLYIERSYEHFVWDPSEPIGDTIELVDDFIIPWYNPRWVSVDI